jgi:hydroxymethylpyrimidine/phosphomethylpyrimidine kinase
LPPVIIRLNPRSTPVAEARTTPGTQVALAIGGSDSCGGAGIQADLKTFSVMDVYGATAITAITAQNTKGVHAIQLLDADLIEKQIDAVASDIEIDATKTGMLGSAANIKAVAAAIRRANLFPLVVDPVMVAKSGDALLDDDAVDALIEHLLPLAAILTPNRFEAARLLGQDGPLENLGKAPDAAAQICRQTGAKACLIKGFHRPNAEEGEAVDIFFDGTEAHEVAADWRPTQNTHGSGCVLAAAIAAALAHDQPIDQAVQTAKAVVTESIRQATDHGHGRSPVNVLAYAKVKR